MEWWDNFMDWLSGDDDSFSESSFSDADEDFENFYNEVTNNPDYYDDLYVDDSIDWSGSGYGEEDYSASLEGPFAWLYEEDPEFIASILGDDWMGDSQYGWNEDDTSYIAPDDYSGSGFEDLIASNPEFAAWYNEVTNNPEYSEDLWIDDSYDPNAVSSDYSGNKFLEFLNMLTGNIGQNPNRSGNQMGGIGQYLGDFLSSPLAALLLMNQKNKDAREQINIPIGQEAYGSGAGGGSLPDYRISNIQPALLPGMAYANQPTTFNNTPPGMQTGGLTSHHHPQLHSHGPTPGIERGPGLPPPPASKVLFGDGMQGGGIASLENRMDGPGDITQAMLEPGEFVMTRKATENLTPEYLYDLMHQAENAGRMT